MSWTKSKIKDVVCIHVCKIVIWHYIDTILLYSALLLKKMQNWIIQHGKDEYVSYKSVFSSRESLNRVVKPQQEEKLLSKGGEVNKYTHKAWVFERR